MMPLAGKRQDEGISAQGSKSETSSKATAHRHPAARRFFGHGIFYTEYLFAA
jgi:hypothetical protein